MDVASNLNTSTATVRSAHSNTGGGAGIAPNPIGGQHQILQYDQRQQQQPQPRRQQQQQPVVNKTTIDLQLQSAHLHTSNQHSNSTGHKPKKKPVCNANISQFAIETYFIWFSALIFCTELIVDVWLAVLYLLRDQPQWALTTAGLIVVPLALCQAYSLWLLRTDNLPIRRPALVLHVLLLGIPYRYHGILRRVEQDKKAVASQQSQSRAIVMAIRHQISDANAIQTMNATFQYCPQFLFQSFLIVYRKHKCILTGVSAGLAGFSFLWHIFIHFYYLVKRYHETDPAICFDRCYQSGSDNATADNQPANVGAAATIGGTTPRIIDNLSTSATQQPSMTGAQITAVHMHANASGASGPSSLISNNLSQTSASLTDSLRNFEKPQYNTDDNNLMSKRGAGSKMVEKSKIFGFNKRRPIYQQHEHEEFDMNESAGGQSCSSAAHQQQQQHHNSSTVFFEIDDSRVSGGRVANYSGVNASSVSSKFNVSLMSNKDTDNFLNENHSNANLLAKKTLNGGYKYSLGGGCRATGVSDSSLMLCGADLVSAAAGGGSDGVEGVCVACCGAEVETDEIDDLKRETRLMASSLMHDTSMLSMSGACGLEHQHHNQLNNSNHLTHGHPHQHHPNCNRNSLLKRKGICSSQEMLHLVDIMNDHISAEQVDVLAKSLVELGDVSLPPTESADSNDLDAATADSSLDNTKLLLDHFPPHLDDRRLLENIDAAIYENQIIFQERIRKNQLTIQNLKLQDQLLSKCIEDMKSVVVGGVAGISAAAAAADAMHRGVAAVVAGGGSGCSGGAVGGGNGSEVLSIRDYENMCFTDIARQQLLGMKHWRNYFQGIDTSAHDASTVQHSSYYVNTNTMSNSTADLYINEDADDGGASTVIIHDDDEDDNGKGTGGSTSSSGLGIVSKKGVRWSNRLAAQLAPEQTQRHRRRRAELLAVGGNSSRNNETAISDDLYINMNNHHDDGVASAISMDASTTTTRGSNSSVVVELGDADEDGREEEGAVALPQKNILVETINKINVDSPVKCLLGGLLSGGVGSKGQSNM